ncbi:translocator protein-like [Ornithodoros turicata]|uniref:translocator protein-like n=1 Tax=Ornithodoros turicata TaxID=34597 RepID=UPI0031398110
MRNRQPTWMRLEAAEAVEEAPRHHGIGQIVHYLVPFVVPLIPSVGGCYISVYLRKEHRFWYENLRKPKWCPRHWVFFPTYHALFPAMGMASYLVYNEQGFHGPARIALLVYSAQLSLTWAWVPLLFKSRAFKLAAVESAAGSLLVGLTVLLFGRIHRGASVLMVPHFLWSLYLTATSFCLFRNAANQRVK